MDHTATRLLGTRALRWPPAAAIGAIALAAAIGLPLRGGAAGWGAHGNPADLPGGCGSCHAGHGLPKSKMQPARGAEACYRCHGGAGERRAMIEKRKLGPLVNLADIRKEFQKPYRHGAGDSPRPEVARAAGVRTRARPGAPVECLDCHEHHDPPRRPVQVVRGVTVNPSTRSGSRYEYELCYRCHGKWDRSVASLRSAEIEFNRANRSYHPVEAAGRGFDVPSLMQPYTTGSRLNCTDCHGSEQTGGPRGPHGSTHRNLLVRNFTTGDNVFESPFQYALCYGCHQRSSILGDESFKAHRRHVADVRTSCNTCHNSHGSIRGAHLIDFNPAVVRPDPKGRLEYRSLGRRAGECYLTCHGSVHAPKKY